MNKLFARILDGIAMDVLTPRFDISHEAVQHNIALLDNAPLPPRRLTKTPRLFMKQTGSRDVFDIYEYAFPSRVDTSSQKNDTVYGRYYKLNDSTPKSTVILLHGMFEHGYRNLERYAINFIRSGHNCITLTLPYHIERASNGLQSGRQFVSNNLAGIFTALKQAMSDVMSLINWLNASGEKRVGLMGINLGGLIASLVASSTRRVNYLLLLAPAISPLQVTGYTRAGRAVEERIEATGLTKQELYMLFEPWTLLHNRPIVPNSRTLILKAEHDSVIPSDSIDRVCEAWSGPRLLASSHGHLTIMASRKVLKDIVAFLDHAFAPKRTTGVSAE